MPLELFAALGRAAGRARPPEGSMGDAAGVGWGRGADRSSAPR